jgi:hypothetical protein
MADTAASCPADAGATEGEHREAPPARAPRKALRPLAVLIRVAALAAILVLSAPVTYLVVQGDWPCGDSLLDAIADARPVDPGCRSATVYAVPLGAAARAVAGGELLGFLFAPIAVGALLLLGLAGPHDALRALGAAAALHAVVVLLPHGVLGDRFPDLESSSLAWGALLYAASLVLAGGGDGVARYLAGRRGGASTAAQRTWLAAAATLALLAPAALALAVAEWEAPAGLYWRAGDLVRGRGADSPAPAGALVALALFVALAAAPVAAGLLALRRSAWTAGALRATAALAVIAACLSASPRLVGPRAQALLHGGLALALVAAAGATAIGWAYRRASG